MGEIGFDGGTADVARVAALGLLNYGHFTTMRVEDGRVRGPGLHLERLARDCRVLFGTELDTAAVRAQLRAAVPLRGAVTARVTVFDPGLPLERPGAEARPRALVTTRPPAAGEPGPLRVRTAPYERDLPQVKHVGLFGLVHRRRLAQLAGADDALLVDRHGAVTEGTTWNVGFFDGRELVWPDGESLPGVTAALLARAHTGPQRRERVTVDGLGRFEAAFALNAGVGVRPLARIDDVDFDPRHPVLARLRQDYAAVPAEAL